MIVIVHALRGAAIPVGAVNAADRKQSIATVVVMTRPTVVRMQILHVVMRKATNIVQMIYTAGVIVATQTVDNRLGL